MELSISLQKNLELSASLHRRLCPRQVLGVRMARFACEQLGIDPALQCKKIFVYMENGHCIADGVIAVTRASPTNQLMQLLPYGKMAGTFVNLDTRDALRVREHPTCRETALALLPDTSSAWKAHLEAYQFMADDLLLCWERIELPTMPYISHLKHKVACNMCGEFIHEYCEVEINNRVLCKPCSVFADPLFSYSENLQLTNENFLSFQNRIK